MKRLLPLLILVLMAGSAWAQPGRIFPDSLGTHWIYTFFRPMIRPNEPCTYYGLYYLDRDTVIAGNHYQRIAPGFDYNGRRVYDWVRSDTSLKHLYTLDSSFQERLAFDYSLQPGDSTPVLYQRGPFTSKVALYKGKVTGLGPINYSPGFGFGPTYPTKVMYLTCRDLATGDTAEVAAYWGLGAGGPYPLWFFQYLPPGSLLDLSGVTCFNGRTLGGWDRSREFCGCNVLASREPYQNDAVSVRPNPASFHLVVDGLPNSAIPIQLYNSEGALVLSQPLGKDSTLFVAHLPPGLYLWRCGQYSGRVVKE